MTSKEQLLYFFLQGKISLSQYDYKFMANLQTMIQNNMRVTSNQAALFEKLIAKYNKQLVKHGFDTSDLAVLPWKTIIVESTEEYTGASVSLVDEEIIVKVPFNKNFINVFRTKIPNNPFSWNKELKLYSASFGTVALKITDTFLHSHFPSVRYCAELQQVLTDIKRYEAPIWNPTLVKVNDRYIVGACNQPLGELIANTDMVIDMKTLFMLSTLGISVDPAVYQEDPLLEFAASRIYSADITQLETVISWIKSIGCDTVVIGRGLRVKYNQANIEALVESHGMTPVNHMLDTNFSVGGTTVLIQHTSNIGASIPFRGNISKTVVIKDSRPLGAV